MHAVWYLGSFRKRPHTSPDPTTAGPGNTPSPHYTPPYFPLPYPSPTRSCTPTPLCSRPPSSIRRLRCLACLAGGWRDSDGSSVAAGATILLSLVVVFFIAVFMRFSHSERCTRPVCALEDPSERSSTCQCAMLPSICATPSITPAMSRLACVIAARLAGELLVGCRMPAPWP